MVPKNKILENITINDIVAMVNESLNRLLLEVELDFKGFIGKKGSLTKKNLLAPSDIFKSTIELYNKVKADKKTINVSKVFADDPGFLVWKNYVTSMTGKEYCEVPMLRRGQQVYDSDGEPVFQPVLRNIKLVKVRDEHGEVIKDKKGKPVYEKFPKRAVPFFKWIRGLISDRSLPQFGGLPSKIYAFNVGDSYLFGYYNLGVFIANSYSGGQTSIIRLLREICQYNNVVFAITLDMAPTLQKLGLYTNGDVHKVVFGKKLVDKMTFTTNKDLLPFVDTINMDMGDDEEDEEEVPVQRGRRGRKKEIDAEKIKEIISNSGMINFLSKNPQLLDDILENEEVKNAILEKPELLRMILSNDDARKALSKKINPLALLAGGLGI